YGRLTLFSLDRSRTILGPTQANARILATPAISSSLTLLNQQGSRVILSNLLVVPVQDSLLYVQPIFVQGSAPNSFPLLQRVAVFYNNKVGYANTLSDAILQVVSGQPVQPPSEDGGAGGGGAGPPHPPPRRPPPGPQRPTGPAPLRGRRRRRGRDDTPTHPEPRRHRRRPE